MANRHLSRSIVLQSLFEWDFGSKRDSDAIEIFLRNTGEFAPGMQDISFMKNLMEKVLEKKKDLDNIITKAAPDWPLEKISIMDRNILRVGLCELLFSDRSQVPPKVAINEAIELAKSFGSETSSKFVNGVLGAVYKEMGEPGKDDQSKKKFNNNIPDDKLPQERLAGAIIYAKEEDNIFLALVHDIFGHWTLSKGHLEEGEESLSGVKRVIKDELGIDIEVVGEKLGGNEYIAFNPEKGKLRKQVDYYLSESKHEDLRLAKSGGLDDAKWFKLADILDLNFYNDILPIVTKAINILLKK